MAYLLWNVILPNIMNVIQWSMAASYRGCKLDPKVSIYCGIVNSLDH